MLEEKKVILEISMNGKNGENPTFSMGLSEFEHKKEHGSSCH
jgi:hypothetical protein